jgi:hypothetical protein
VSARTLLSRSGRFLLEDSSGEMWLVHDSNDQRVPRIGYRPEPGALRFEFVSETRVFAPGANGAGALGS